MNHEVADTRVNALVDVLRANGFLRSAAAQHVARAREANVNREPPTTSAYPASTSYGATARGPLRESGERAGGDACDVAEELGDGAPLMAGARDARAGEDAVCRGRG
jgi:hypothetical protein